MVGTTAEEFDRQVQTLLDKDYPALAGITEDRLIRLADPLRALVPQSRPSNADAVPFLVVVKSELVPTAEAVRRVSVDGKAGWTDMAEEIDDYKPIEGLDIPGSPVYLLVDVTTGKETLNVRPNDALPMVIQAGRTPLTTDEGVALVTQFPEVLKVHNAFQALGSRADNKRIPSFWISKGAPRLGWCWAGNPHTWLGAGSAAARYGIG
jgi:hypothetical protein